MNYKVIMQFDGTRYLGWQKQAKNEMTIQGKLENILSKKLGQTQVIGCSRTDAGVHAINYICNFASDKIIEVDELKRYINNYLPDDIVVKDIKLASDRFHSRYNTTSKTYIYKIDNSAFGDVFERKYSWHIAKELNIENMKKAGNILLGTHDFKAFTNKAKNKNTIRTINSIDITNEKDLIYIKINGNSFLLNMVRILVGTIIEIGKNERSLDSISSLLENLDRNLSGERAPAKGLYLLESIY
ncbi:MAG: tRNA pseudouridine(38-40) synthase TruA [Sarcina sp.]